MTATHDEVTAAPVGRRTFLKTASAAAGLAATGLEGILAAGRAPAYAQGTRLNIVRWVDFIPACDVELKRQAGEASKALGAEVVFEFINANDIQPRITAAMQSGAGPDIMHMLHGASIYIAAKRGQDKIKDEKGEPLVRDIQHARLPAGPAGSWSYHTAFAHGVMKYTKNPKLAKDFLKWMHGKEQYGKWFQVAEGFSIGSTKSWEQNSLWTTIDEPTKGFKTAADNSRVIGFAGPPSARATEVYTKYVIIDMYAKGVQGTKAEDSVKWAASELGKIYS